MTQDGSPTPDDGDDERLDGDYRVSSLELFFDLVFVFAITQVTSLVLSDTSAAGFARSLRVVAPRDSIAGDVIALSGLDRVITVES